MAKEINLEILRDESLGQTNLTEDIAKYLQQKNYAAVAKILQDKVKSAFQKPFKNRFLIELSRYLIKEAGLPSSVFLDKLSTMEGDLLGESGYTVEVVKSFFLSYYERMRENKTEEAEARFSKSFESWSRAMKGIVPNEKEYYRLKSLASNYFMAQQFYKAREAFSNAQKIFPDRKLDDFYHMNEAHCLMMEAGEKLRLNKTTAVPITDNNPQPQSNDELFDLTLFKKSEVLFRKERGTIFMTAEITKLTFKKNDAREIVDFLNKIKYTNVRELYFNECKMYAIQMSLERCRKLELLEVKKCPIISFNYNLDQLYKLYHIKLIENEKLKEFPESVLKVKKMHSLEISQCNIETIPESINLPQYLSSLNLDKNRITVIPPQLFQLPKLNLLKLNYNQLSEITFPENVISPIHHLKLSYNQLTDITAITENLPRIYNLDLSSNQIEIIPDSITKIIKLYTLDIRYNPLTYISPALLEMESFKSLGLRENEIEALENTRAEKDAFHEKRKLWEKDYERKWR